MMDGLVFDIYRGTTHDGPGIRDTVFLKGCSLACAWCQNPESIETADKVWHRKSNCIGCGKCLEVCQSGAVSACIDGVRFNYSKCNGCKACTNVCCGGALSSIAERLSVDEVLNRVKKDRAFCEASGGGVTLSGGEPLLQAEFSLELLRKFKECGFSTALDTCGMVSEKVFMAALPMVDILLLDLKIFDCTEHKRLTGADNRRILENAIAASAFARRNDKLRIWVRTPIIPGATDSKDNICRIADFIRTELGSTVERWELCMFNRAATTKYQALGMEWSYQNNQAISVRQRDSLLELATDRVDVEVIASGIVQE